MVRLPGILDHEDFLERSLIKPLESIDGARGVEVTLHP